MNGLKGREFRKNYKVRDHRQYRNYNITIRKTVSKLQAQLVI